MFVDEGLYRAALDQDGSLFEAGAEAGVIVASPATLIALLRTVAYGWQQETVAESARAISRLGRELYDRLGVFAGHLAKVGRGPRHRGRRLQPGRRARSRRACSSPRASSPSTATGGDPLPERAADRADPRRPDRARAHAGGRRRRPPGRADAA